MVIWKLIALQRSDYTDDKIDMPAEQFEPIYDFVCNMYFNKHITNGMSESEERAIAAELAEKMFFDALEGYTR